MGIICISCMCSPGKYWIYIYIFQDVISYGCGNDMTNEYRSLVFYHEDKPKWFETIKVITCL